jgi:uncharacterized membrane protein YtjA (UPF0391 family)
LTGVIPAAFLRIVHDFVPGKGGFFCRFRPLPRLELSVPGRINSATRRDECGRARVRNGIQEIEVFVMLSWVVTFLIVALIAGILGFGGLAGASIEIAKIIFFVAVVLFLVSAVVGLARGRTRV